MTRSLVVRTGGGRYPVRMYVYVIRAICKTDWYINQMKKQAYESDPLPISWQPEDYVQGTRDAAYVFPMTDKSIDLKTALDFVRSNDPKFKKIPGINQELDYIPAQTLTMGVRFRRGYGCRRDRYR